MLECQLKIKCDKGEVEVRISNETGEVEITGDSKQPRVYARHWLLVQRIIKAMRECEESQISLKKKNNTRNKKNVT